MSSIIEFTPVAISATGLYENTGVYNHLLYSALMSRAINRGMPQTDPDRARIGNLHNFIVSYLSSTDFYSAPASSRYHDMFPGGLLYHHLQVYNQILDLRQIGKFQNVDIASAVLVALVHDWCKIGMYEKYAKNVKNPVTKEWDSVNAYRIRDDSTGRLGHGPQSVVMAMRLCNIQYSTLTDDELAAIRWHSATYDVTSYDIYALNDCNRNIPLVHMLQFADQLAITNY